VQAAPTPGVLAEHGSTFIRYGCSGAPPPRRERQPERKVYDTSARGRRARAVRPVLAASFCARCTRGGSWRPWISPGSSMVRKRRKSPGRIQLKGHSGWHGATYRHREQSLRFAVHGTSCNCVLVALRVEWSRSQPDESHVRAKAMGRHSQARIERLPGPLVRRCHRTRQNAPIVALFRRSLEKDAPNR